MNAERFLGAIRSYGLEPPPLIETEMFVRFPGYRKGRGNKAGWYFLQADECCGWFGDWSTGLFESWLSDNNRLNHSRKGKGRSRSTHVGNPNENIKLAEKHRVAGQRAREIWRRARDVDPEHRYIRSKRIRPLGAKSYQTALVIPVVNFQRSLTSLQFIAPDGGKRLLSGGQKKGCFIPVADRLKFSERILICEGWATACTLADWEPSSSVLAAIDAGNLMSVTLGARARWPSSELVVAGDDDRLTPGNPGATKARAAAIAANALLAMPKWGTDLPIHLSDFNDLDSWRVSTKGE